MEKIKILDLWNDNADYVLQICMHLVKKISIAQDIRQNVFLKVMERGHSFRFQSSVRTWLYTISYRCCMDYFRQKKLESRIVEEFSNYDSCVASDHPAPAWSVHSASDMKCPISQMMLELYYDEQWSCDEIAIVFGIEKALVRKRIQMGISQLEEALGE